MIILNSLTENTIRVIPREGIALNVLIQDEQTKEEIIHQPTITDTPNGISIDLVTDLIENRKYKLTIKDADDNILYRDLLLTMSLQEIEDYTIHKDEYQTPQEDTVKTKYKFI